MTIEIPLIIQRLAVAFAIGLLMGLERGWHERERAEGRRVAGFRTFGLLGLLGGLSAILANVYGAAVLAAAIIAVAALFAVAQWYELKESGNIGITTNVAAFAAFSLGALAGHGALKEAAASAVVATILLSIKPEMHGLLARMDRAELLATLRLLLISVVILPVLPNEAVDPWGAINPFRVWLMVVLVAGISYIGYFAIKLTGRRRGSLATGILGGLISSTATTVSFSRRSREHPRERDLLVAGILVSTATMLPRTMVISGIIAPALFRDLALPLLGGSACAYLAGLLFSARGKPADTKSDETPRNPLALTTALQFAVVLVLVLLLAHGARNWFGESGLYGLATLSGLVDIDAATLSLAAMAGDERVAAVVAGRAIVVAAAVNVAIKVAIVLALGGLSMALRILLGLAPTLIVIGVGFYLDILAVRGAG